MPPSFSFLIQEQFHLDHLDVEGFQFDPEGLPGLDPLLRNEEFARVALPHGERRSRGRG